MKNLKFIIVIFAIIISNLTVHAQENLITVKEMLQLGTVYAPKPLYAESGDNGFDEKNLLEFENLDIQTLQPKENNTIVWNQDQKFKWNKVSIKEGSINFNSSPKESHYQIKYLAFYVESNRWLNAEINLESCQLFNVYLNGSSIVKQNKPMKDSQCKDSNVSQKIKLERGKHLIVIKSIMDDNSNSDWNIKASFKVGDGFAKENLSVSLDPNRFTSVDDLLDNPKIKGVSISADGSIAAIKVSERSREKDKDESWLEFYDVENAELIRSTKSQSDITSIDWSPVGFEYAFRTSNSHGTSLMIADFKSGTTNTVLENVKNLGGFEWAPDGKSIFYTIYEESEKGDGLTELIEKPQYRVPGSKSKSFIYKINIADKSKFKLTAGEISTGFQSVNNDGTKILFVKGRVNFDERPFALTSYYILDLKSMSADSLFTIKFGGGASFVPNTNKILVTAGPSSFGEIGLDVSTEMIPNDYDTQAYLYNIETGKVDAISKNFDPKIGSPYFTSNTGEIYFTTTDRSFSHLYSYDLKSNKFNYVDLNAEYLHAISFSKNSSHAVFSASSSNDYAKAYTLDLSSGEVNLLLDADPQYKNIKLGDVKDYNFNTVDGTNILGRVYYPPNFNESKKYPAIVYYYAGTSPVTREFEGRYPKNIWAANGYIVYVLQPRGATGFGQKFSAFHVNDWGEETAKDIIKGTEEFLTDHPFVDKNRLGCIGASYGGFMTMNLISKTDLFAAAISHAGISALTSYWGEGYWGLSYSTVATAESYPWNRKDIYVDRSPIYNADKINTPLLLLHGDSDTNVPPGESYQMFAALKILNKDVTLVTVPGLDHHIMQYDKRKKWTKTIIAYFDKYLKDQPQWWNELYGD